MEVVALCIIIFLLKEFLYTKAIRKVLVDELKDYVGEPVLLDIDSKILSNILFDIYKKDNSEYKKFSEDISSIIKKIDFSKFVFVTKRRG